MSQNSLQLIKRAQQARAKAYDVVLNGTELGGGSIRIHREEVQQKIFSLLKIEREEARNRFGFLLDALLVNPCPIHRMRSI